MQFKIYHNPKCSKSREAFEYLQSLDIEVEVVEYLDDPPREQEIRDLVELLGIAPSSLVRARDFSRLGFEAPDRADAWIRLLVKHPVLLERPIVICGDDARIARPLSTLVEWLEEIGVSDSGA